MSKGLGLYGVDRCSKCGATRCHQKYPQAVRRFMPNMSAIVNTNPVDGFLCPKCKEGFRVAHLETDAETYFTDLMEEGECAPNFCPNCGFRLDEDEWYREAAGR